MFIQDVNPAKSTKLLVLHGGLGIDGSTMLPWLTGLGEHYHVQIPDLPGNGRSVVNYPHPPDTLDAYLEPLTELLPADSKTVIFGHSAGSVLARELALRLPDRVAGVVMAGAVPNYGEIAKRWMTAFAGDTKKTAVVQQLLAGQLETDEDYRRLYGEVVPTFFADPDLGAAMRDLWLRTVKFSVDAFKTTGPALLMSHNVDDGRRLTVPSLWIAGTADFSATPADARACLPSCDAGDVVELEAGHYPHVERTDEFCRAVVEWSSRRVWIRSQRQPI